MPISKVDRDYEFGTDVWVVSLINSQIDDKTNSSVKCGGHAKIIVEGVTKDEKEVLSKLFIAEYHIWEANRTHEESCIPQALRNTKCKYMVLYTERNEYKDSKREKQYKDASSKSWYAFPDEVRRMINDIKDEQHCRGKYQVNHSRLLRIPPTAALPKDIEEDIIILQKIETKVTGLWKHNGNLIKKELDLKNNAAFLQLLDNEQKATEQSLIEQIRAIFECQRYSPDFQYFGMWCFHSYRGGHNCITWAESKLELIEGCGNGKKLMDSCKAIPQKHVCM